MIERVVHKSGDHKSAEEWDIQQQISMTPEQRQEAADILKKRVYGENSPDVREAESRK